MDLERASDNELVEAYRRADGPEADSYLELLYRRSYPKVAHWCLRCCRDREEAADLAQEVFLRVHSRLRSFRADSSFTTWLYTVMRSVAINRGLATQRRRSMISDLDLGREPIDSSPDAAESAQRKEFVGLLREAMTNDLKPLEAQVLYLHFANGLTLHAITDLLELKNKSGAKAFLVSGTRKLRRILGRRIRGRRSTAERT